MRLSGGKPQPEPQFAEPAHTREHVEERLEYWRRALMDFETNQLVSREEIVRTLDRWLDELLDVIGR